MTSPVVLETRSLLKRFGGITPTNDVSIQVHKGARHALIGRDRLLRPDRWWRRSPSARA